MTVTDVSTTCAVVIFRVKVGCITENEKHRQAVAKLRSSNYKLRIETDRYHLPKIPENLRMCQLCSSNGVENKINFLFECNLYKNLRQPLFQDVEAKYSKFVDLKKSEHVVFLSNNIDPNKTSMVNKIKCYDCQASNTLVKPAET